MRRRPAPKKWSEEDLGKVVVEYLKSDGWDVYQEVQMYQGGPVADIVATSGPLVMVCELKRSMSLTLLAQADYWKRWTNVVRVFIPYPKRGGNTRQFAFDICKDRGIGVVTVKAPLPRYADNCDEGGSFREWVKPAFRRTPMAKELRAVLSEKHKQHAKAGSAAGGHWTPFKQTVERLTTLVRKEPGISMKDAFSRIEHHYASYASGRARVSALVDRGVIKGIEVRRDGRKLSLWPV